MDLLVTPEEKRILRELAKTQLDCANLPVMREREKAWYAHNTCRGERPMVVMESESFEHELIHLETESPLAQEIEHNIRSVLIHALDSCDDLVTPSSYLYVLPIQINRYGFDIRRDHAIDEQGRDFGFKDVHPIEVIEEDFHKLSPATFSFDKEASDKKEAAIAEIIGDILPIERENDHHKWSYMFTNELMSLMGMENWMISLCDEPEYVHKIMEYLLDNALRFMKWQEDNQLLTMNNGNHYVGSGSRGFTTELSKPADGKIRTTDLWYNTNSQEASSISPAMYGEFVFPYIKRFAEHAGLLYYGCCEPVHDFWKDYLSTIPNLRKISISAWCNEEYMGEALRGSKVIYSRKPSPNFIGVETHFNEDAFRAHITKTLRAAKGCETEIIFRDSYTQMGEPWRAKRAVEIVREQIDREWNR